MNGLATSTCCISYCVPEGSDCCGIVAGTPHYCRPGIGLCSPCPSGSICHDTNGKVIDVTCCLDQVCGGTTTTSSMRSTSSTQSTTSSTPSKPPTQPTVTVSTRITESYTVSIKGTVPVQTPITTEVLVPVTISYTTVYVADSSTYSVVPIVSSSSSFVVIQDPAATANPTASSAANHNILTGTNGKSMALAVKIGIGVGASLGVIILAILICLLIPRRKRPAWLGGDRPAPTNLPPVFIGSGLGAGSPETGYSSYSPKPTHSVPPLNARAYNYDQDMQPSLPEMGGYTYNQDPMAAERPIDTGSYSYRRDPILPAGWGQRNRRVSELD